MEGGARPEKEAWVMASGMGRTRDVLKERGEKSAGRQVESERAVGEGREGPKVEGKGRTDRPTHTDSQADRGKAQEAFLVGCAL